MGKNYTFSASLIECSSQPSISYTEFICNYFLGCCSQNHEVLYLNLHQHYQLLNHLPSVECAKLCAHTKSATVRCMQLPSELHVYFKQLPIRYTCFTAIYGHITYKGEYRKLVWQLHFPSLIYRAPLKLITMHLLQLQQLARFLQTYRNRLLSCIQHVVDNNLSRPRNMSEGNAFLLTVPCQDHRQYCLVTCEANLQLPNE